MTRLQSSKLKVFGTLGVAAVAFMTWYFVALYQRDIPQPVTNAGLETERESPELAQFRAYCRMPDGRELAGIASVPSTANPSAMQEVEIRSPENGNSLGVVRLAEADCSFSSGNAADANGGNG